MILPRDVAFSMSRMNDLRLSPRRSLFPVICFGEDVFVACVSTLLKDLLGAIGPARKVSINLSTG
jgi:hypothetical protein